MMTLATYLFSIASALVILIVVLEMLRRRRLRERHALWWTIAGTLALIISVFPSSLLWAAGLIGVEVPLNLVFFVSLAVLFLVNVQQNVELTGLEAKTRTLAENTALLELRIEDLENGRSGLTKAGATVGDEVHDHAERRSDHEGEDGAGDQVARDEQ